MCDLPYGITNNSWDTIIPFEALWEQWHRVCRQNAAILLFCQMPFTATVVMSNPKEFRYEWIYKKTNGTGFLNAKKMPLKAHEDICVFYRKMPTYNPQFWQSKPYKRTGDERTGYVGTSSNYGKFVRRDDRVSADGRRYPIDVIEFSNSGDRSAKLHHPTQKPIALLEYLIKTYTNSGETVLDNCMGSGSTGVACVNTGRKFIGIELDHGYFEIARKRIADAQKQMQVGR